MHFCIFDCLCRTACHSLLKDYDRRNLSSLSASDDAVDSAAPSKECSLKLSLFLHSLRSDQQSSLADRRLLIDVSTRLARTCIALHAHLESIRNNVLTFRHYSSKTESTVKQATRLISNFECLFLCCAFGRNQHCFRRGKMVVASSDIVNRSLRTLDVI